MLLSYYAFTSILILGLSPDYSVEDRQSSFLKQIGINYQARPIFLHRSLSYNVLNLFPDTQFSIFYSLIVEMLRQIIPDNMPILRPIHLSRNIFSSFIIFLSLSLIINNYTKASIFIHENSGFKKNKKCFLNSRKSKN